MDMLNRRRLLRRNGSAERIEEEGGDGDRNVRAWEGRWCFVLVFVCGKRESLGLDVATLGSCDGF